MTLTKKDDKNLIKIVSTHTQKASRSTIEESRLHSFRLFEIERRKLRKTMEKIVKMLKRSQNHLG